MTSYELKELFLTKIVRIAVRVTARKTDADLLTYFTPTNTTEKKMSHKV